MVLVHCTEACITSLESFGPMMTKLRSGQGKRDADADADTDAEDAAGQSKTFISPFRRHKNK